MRNESHLFVAVHPLRPSLPARPCSSVLPAFSSFLPLLSRSLLLARALCVSPAHLLATPALPPLALSPCHFFPPSPTTSLRPNLSSPGGASFAPCCPYITVRYHCLCCTSSPDFHSGLSLLRYSDVPILSPGVKLYPKASQPGPPMWVSCVWHVCTVWPTEPPDGLIPCQQLRRTIAGLPVAGMAPPGEVCAKKKTQQQPQTEQPQPRGEQAKSEAGKAKQKVRRTKTRRGGRPARPGQAGHARAQQPGSPPEGRAVGGGRAPDPGRPTPRQEAPPAGTLMPPQQRAKPARKSARCGVGDGSPRPRPPAATASG